MPLHGSDARFGAREVDELAGSLARARLDGTLLDRPNFDLTLTDAYAVQEAVTKRLGGPLIGWKVGSTSEQAQARLGTDEPGAGRLLQRFCHRDGDRVPVHRAHHLCVEAEFGFRIAHLPEPRRGCYTAADLRGSVAAFIPAMEIVGSRFSDGLAGSGRSLVTADGGANAAFVGGAETPLPEELELPAQRCRLYLNGALAAEGTGARALGDPLRVLTWLANHLFQRGLRLEPGAIVSTGTCTGLLPVGPGDRLRADFGRLGAVEAVLVEARTGRAANGR